MKISESVDDGSNAGLCVFCGGLKGDCDEKAEAQAVEEYRALQKETDRIYAGHQWRK